MGQVFFDPGALNQRVQLQSLSEIPDGCGGLEKTWTNIASLWASVKSVVPTSAELAQQVTEETLLEVSIRYREDVTSGWRFLKDARSWRIMTVADPDQRGRYLVCRVTAEGR